MKQTLLQIWQALRASNASTRMAIAAGVLLALVVTGASMYRSANPNMEFFVGDLDNTSFSKATRALSQAGVRFETSVGGAPYTIFVESGQKYKAHNAIAEAGAMDVGATGINTGGASTAWASSIERQQMADARYWQEVEKQLMQLHWVRSAKVIARQPVNRVLGRAPQPTVSVLLTTRGLRPTPEQSQNVGNIVRTAFSVPEENITILDQNGALIFNGSNDERLDEHLTYQRAFSQDQTATVQQLLDSVYGPGLTKVIVRGDWSFVKTETVGNILDPGKQVVQESSVSTSTPVATYEGGPAGLEESFTGAPNQGGTPAKQDPATRKETDKQFAFGSQTTHRVDDAPVLERLSVSLTLDESLADQAEAVAMQVKAAVGFQEQRGDLMATNTTALNGIERDENGKPVAPEALVAPEAPSPMMGLLLERGVEISALLVFVFLLVRSLRAPKLGATSKSGGGMNASDLMEGEIEIDPSLLARKHIDNLLENDPDRVSSLLTRWAMGEDFYAKAKS
ncbi:MAG TPA: flagellar M-ring protein FliF C-terminal domain-containing protein [Planctomycetota bacterium]|nr:flagellar M-ring protein FliF C-terminal domain-containing protein [Planctomycetota bacterium]